MKPITVISWVLPAGSGRPVIRRASHERCGRGRCVCAGLLGRFASMRSEPPRRATPRTTRQPAHAAPRLPAHPAPAAQEAITDNHRAAYSDVGCLLTLTFINERTRTLSQNNRVSCDHSIITDTYYVWGYVVTSHCWDVISVVMKTTIGHTYQDLCFCITHGISI